MYEDPFARFERSQAGMLIPVVLFLAGAALSFLAIGKIDEVMVREEQRAAEERELPEPGERNELEADEHANADPLTDWVPSPTETSVDQEPNR